MTVTAAQFNTAIEALADRTAALVPAKDFYVAGNTWTKPANALYVAIVAVGNGGTGGGGKNTGGAGGGASSGEIAYWFGTADQLPSTLTIAHSGGQTTVTGTDFYLNAVDGVSGTAGGTSPDDGGKGGGHRLVTIGGTGGVIGDVNGVAADSLFGFVYGGGGGGAAGAPGGKGGTGAGGAAGGSNSGGTGGAGGKGYGAGGGGGAGDACGGGGGGRGWGDGVSASAGADWSVGVDPAGGAGATWCVQITTWRGVSL